MSKPKAAALTKMKAETNAAVDAAGKLTAKAAKDKARVREDTMANEAKEMAEELAKKQVPGAAKFSAATGKFKEAASKFKALSKTKPEVLTKANSKAEPNAAKAVKIDDALPVTSVSSGAGESSTNAAKEKVKEREDALANDAKEMAEQLAKSKAQGAAKFSAETNKFKEAASKFKALSKTKPGVLRVLAQKPLVIKVALRK